MLSFSRMDQFLCQRKDRRHRCTDGHTTAETTNGQVKRAGPQSNNGGIIALVHVDILGSSPTRIPVTTRATSLGSGILMNLHLPVLEIPYCDEREKITESKKCLTWGKRTEGIVIL